MITAIWTVLIFCVIIAIHEFGHFISAKLSGIVVHEFAIGMGPKLFGFEKGGTTYTLRLLPIGGYCSLEGENGDSSNSNAFCNKSAWKRFVVLVSGSLMNLFLGFLILACLFTALPAQPSNVISEVIAGSAFSKAGIVSGDKIIRMESENFSSAIRTYNDISYYIYQNQDAETDVTILRNGEKLTFKITPEPDPESGRKIFGFRPAEAEKNVFSILYTSFWQSVFVVKVVLISFWQLLTGTVPITALSGPVGIVNEINVAAKSGGAVSVLNLAALISINLGVVNLFPFPALDGGRVLLLIVEKIRKKPLKPEQEGIINLAGFVILILLALLITFFDITKLFGA